MPFRPFVFLLLAFALPCVSQINPTGVVNIASFAPQGLPNADIARGSVFTVFGTGLAADGLAEAGAFPLPTELGGASLEVTVAGTTRACPLLFTTPGQVAALLPSEVPPGVGVLRLGVGGTVYEEPITVVERSFGIFAQNQRGNGLAVFQNFVSQADQPVNGPTRPIAPGEVGTLWGVGLGPVAGDEAAGPLPGDLGREGLTVYVGDRRVTDILYAGRSGCCAGIDQIVFRIPNEAPLGCYVPVTVVTGGVTSNYGALSIGRGEVCGRPELFSEADIEAIAGDDDFRFGRIELSRIDWTLQGFPVLEEQVSGVFRGFAGTEYLQNPSYLSSGDDTCLVRMISANPATQGVIAPFTPLDAGPSIAYETPTGVRQMDPVEGVYLEDVADLVPNGDPAFTPGPYSWSGPGGADVGSFEASTDVQTLLDWTNRDQIGAVDLGGELRVSWSAPGADGRVFVFGVSMAENRLGSPIGASFVCDAAIEDGELVIPDYVLGALPPSGMRQAPIVGPIPDGTLQVGVDGTLERFSAEGLDQGIVTRSFSEGLLGLRYQ